MAARYEIRFTASADKELERLRVFERRRVADDVVRHLTTSPNVKTKNIKCLGEKITADFHYIPPLWELRTGEYRVFYVIDPSKIVVVHAVRVKPPHKTTAEVLNEANGN